MISSIVFAAGCFWGVEKHFEHMKGVIKAESGYAGGNYPNPTYEDVVKFGKYKINPNIINYTESVKVTFDTTKTDAKTLIKSFWELHDPTQKNRQGNDIGTNYRSAIFYTNEYQEKVAKETKQEYQKLLTKAGYGKITTEIKPLKHFYMAEDYHQDFLQKHPNGYCPNHSTGVRFAKTKEDIKTITPLKGKEIIVIKSKFYCPYCEKFAEDVTSLYKGSIPLRTVTKDQLKGFSIKSKTDVTPTILFIEDGKEVFGYNGYLKPKDFYKALGAFKLGKNSQAYYVAFHQGTDAPGCRQYKIFENTPDGVFIDKLSGDILFDTRDRFHSGTGWLSFYKAKDGSVIEREDNSFGLHRIEIVAKKSGIHLGHVFPLPDGRRRFCIDATVLEFVPREKVKGYQNR